LLSSALYQGDAMLNVPRYHYTKDYERREGSCPFIWTIFV